MQALLWSFITLWLLHGAVGAIVLPINNTDACPGSILTLECTVYGSVGDSTVWKGTALSECNDNSEITLTHNRFEYGTLRQCNNGTITGQSMRVEDYSNSSNESIYVSQLVVVVQPEMIGNDIVCIHDNGSKSTEIGNISLISTVHVCNINDTEPGHTPMISKETKVPILVSMSVVLLSILLLLSAILIFLLYGFRKKLWDRSTLNSACDTGKGMSLDCHVINNKVDNYMEVVKIVDNEKMGIYNQNLSNYEVQRAKNIIIKAEQGEISICNLNNLLYALREQVSSHWYPFGVSLGVPKQILEQLKHDYRDEECLVEVLDYWLRHHPGKPTWQEVMEARNIVHCQSV